MNILLDDYKDTVLPGYLLKDLAFGERYVILAKDGSDILQGDVPVRPLIINDGSILDTMCGYHVECKATLIHTLQYKWETSHFHEITFFNDTKVFNGRAGLVADKIHIGPKQHIKELPYLEDPVFVEKFKDIHWIKNLVPELFETISFYPDYLKKKEPASSIDKAIDELGLVFTAVDVQDNPKIIKNLKLSDKQQCAIIFWNPNTVYYMDDPCEDALISLCKNNIDIIKDYVENYVTSVTDNVKREIANHDFKFLIDRYHILPKDLVMRAMRLNLEYLLHLEISKDIIMEIIKENPRAIFYINGTDDEAKLEAIKMQPQLIKEFKNVTVDMLLIASGENPDIFKQCNENRPDIVNKLLGIRGELIKYIDPINQTEELCMIAVQSDPEAIKHISKDRQTETVCQAAVQVDPNSIQHIDNPSESVCILVVSKLPGLLKDIKNQTPSICQAAVRKAPLAIRFVNDQTDDLCIMSVSKDPTAIKYIKNPTLELICRSIQKDPTMLNEIETKDLNLQICMSCAFINPNSIEHIKDADLKFDCTMEFLKIITAVQ